MGVPLVDLSWVDSKVVGILSNYKTEASVSKFLDKCPILKVGGHSSFFSILPYSSIESVFLGDQVPVPHSFTCIPIFFQTYTFLFHLTNLQWASFERSMWLPPKFIQTHGRPFRPFACYAVSCVFTLLPLPSFLIIPLTHPTYVLALFDRSARECSFQLLRCLLQNI